jgi:hypothetical protein
MGGEQRSPASDHPMQQRTLRRTGGDGVDTPQQQGMVCEQQPAVAHFVDDGGGRVYRDRDGVDVLVGVSADQSD